MEPRGTFGTIRKQGALHTSLWPLTAKWGQELLSSFRYPLTPPSELLLKVSVCLGGKLNKAIENINIKYYIICPGLKRFWLRTY